MKKIVALFVIASVFAMASCAKKVEEKTADTVVVAPMESTPAMVDTVKTDSTAVKVDSAAAPKM